MATVEEVADHILYYSEYGLSHRELHKLLYFAQGFYLAQYDEPLFNESLQAWQHGPVSPRIWGKYRHFGFHLIARPANVNILPAHVSALILAVVVAFNPLGQNRLIEYSHMDSPWAANYIPDANQELSKAQLKSYFSSYSGIDDYLNVSRDKLMFCQQIESRVAYLNNLPSIGDNWISGGANAPSSEVCSAAARFLKHYQRHMFANNARPEIPKLIMGPIPSGGVGLELETSVRTVYVNFYNDKNIEIDIDTNGEFAEIETTLDQFEEELGNHFKTFLA